MYVAFQPSSRDTFVGRATKACLRIPMSTVRKDERDVAVFAFAFPPDAEDFTSKTR